MTRAIAMERSNPVDSHQPRDAVLAAGFPSFPEVKKHPRRPVNSMARLKRRADQPQQSRILLRTIRYGLLNPRVVAAWRDTQQAAHRSDVV